MHLIWIDYQLINFTERRNLAYIPNENKNNVRTVDAATLNCIQVDSKKRKRRVHGVLNAKYHAFEIIIR